MLIEAIYGSYPGAHDLPEDGYAFETNDLDVGVGDVVEVPGSWSYDPVLATVVAIGSSYRGPTKSVIRVVEHADGRQPRTLKLAAEYRAAAGALMAQYPNAAELLLRAADAPPSLRPY